MKLLQRILRQLQFPFVKKGALAVLSCSRSVFFAGGLHAGFPVFDNVHING